jgi:hypothetical protein
MKKGDFVSTLVGIPERPYFCLSFVYEDFLLLFIELGFRFYLLGEALTAKLGNGSLEAAEIQIYSTRMWRLETNVVIT